MKVYRIEHETRRIGPYQGMADMTVNDYFATRHPSPHQDGVLFNWDYFFGFASMRQMFQWFHWTDVFRWRRQGFRVYKYKMRDLNKVSIGGRQLAFVRASATSRNEVRMAQLAKHLIRIPMISS